MKRLIFVLGILALLLAACTSPAPAGDSTEAVLEVTDGTDSQTYTVEDLEALAAVEATFNDVAYVGVPLYVLLEDAGFTPDELQIVKAVATDGYSVNYQPDVFLLEDTLVAYAQADGPLTEDDGVFRMVLPGQEGNQNVRMLGSIQVTP